MSTIVLDTNVIISALLFGGNPRKIMELIISGDIECSLSPAILQELTDVLQRPKFGFSSTACLQIAEELHGICHLVSPESSLTVIQDDPDDNRILECALEANASFIITGDPHLLSLQEFQKIKIIDPSEYLKANFPNLK